MIQVVILRVQTESRCDLLGYYVHGLLRSVMYEPERGLFVLSGSDRCSAVMSSWRCGEIKKQVQGVCIHSNIRSLGCTVQHKVFKCHPEE